MNLLESIQFFKEAHKEQKRKYSGAAYFTHPLRCMSRAMLIDGVLETELIGIVGHDYIEDVRLPPRFEYDVDLSIKTLQDEGFDPVSINLMVELTNPSKLYPHLSRRERKKMDRDHIAQASKIARQAKMIDRTDNLREMRRADRDFIELYVGESKLLLEACAAADPVLAAELEQALDDALL